MVFNPQLRTPSSTAPDYSGMSSRPSGANPDASIMEGVADAANFAAKAIVTQRDKNIKNAAEDTAENLDAPYRGDLKDAVRLGQLHNGSSGNQQRNIRRRIDSSLASLFSKYPGHRTEIHDAFTKATGINTRTMWRDLHDANLTAMEKEASDRQDEWNRLVNKDGFAYAVPDYATRMEEYDSNPALQQRAKQKYFEYRARMEGMAVKAKTETERYRAIENMANLNVSTMVENYMNSKDMKEAFDEILSGSATADDISKFNFGLNKLEIELVDGLLEDDVVQDWVSKDLIGYSDARKRIETAVKERLGLYRDALINKDTGLLAMNESISKQRINDALEKVYGIDGMEVLRYFDKLPAPLKAIVEMRLAESTALQEIGNVMALGHFGKVFNNDVPESLAHSLLQLRVLEDPQERSVAAATMIDKGVEIIMSKKVSREDRIKAAKSFFDPTNSFVNEIGKGGERFFRILTSPEFSKELMSLGDETVTRDYKRFVAQIFEFNGHLKESLQGVIQDLPKAHQARPGGRGGGPTRGAGGLVIEQDGTVAVHQDGVRTQGTPDLPTVAPIISNIYKFLLEHSAGGDPEKAAEMLQQTIQAPVTVLDQAAEDNDTVGDQSSLNNELADPSPDTDVVAQLQDNDMLEFIALHEAPNTYGSAEEYDVTLGYGKFDPEGHDGVLTDKTVGQIITMQGEMLKHPENNFGGKKSSAVGKYQITRRTLRDVMAEAGVTESDLFNKATQDKLARALLKRRGYDKFKEGKMDRASFLKGLGQEWAGLIGVNELPGDTESVASTASFDGLQYINSYGKGGTPVISDKQPFDRMDKSIVSLLQKTGEETGLPMRLTPHGTSRTRGSTKSQHYFDERGSKRPTRAGDIYIGDMSKEEIAMMIESAIANGATGFGWYSHGQGKNTVHFDTRTHFKHAGQTQAFWHRTSKGDKGLSTMPKYVQDAVKRGLARRNGTA